MTEFVPGLVSVTFRQKTPEEVIVLAAQAGAIWLEWGGDIHVPPGDLAGAHTVGAMTREAGLVNAAYGSYYRVGAPPSPENDFAQTLASAKALGAPVIRVWAGQKSSADVGEAERGAILRDSQRICDMADMEDITVATEFHGGTLTDTVESTLKFIAETDRPNLRTLWQPLDSATPARRRWELEQLAPWLAHLHVYHGQPGNPGPLALGEAEWSACLKALMPLDRPIGMLLEFVQEAVPEQFLADAAVLRGWLDGRAITEE